MGNVDIIQQLFQAYETGDFPTLDAIFSDDIVFHMPGRSSLAGTFKGKGEVFGWFERMGAVAGETFRIEVHAITADGEHGTALVTESGHKNGKDYEWREVDVFHIRDGKITEGWVLIDDLYSADEFFA